MSQQVLAVTRVALFAVVDGKTTEKGNCACAVVGAPGAPPRYSLVCYNDARETLCTSSITSSNEHSLQFQLQVNDYASFRDDRGDKWSMMFLKSTQLDKFCAALGCALYGAGGSPSHTAVIADFAPPRADMKLTLQHRVKVRYTAFAVRTPSLGVANADEIIETNGDRPYNFQPTQSSMAREDAKGFESCVLGMMEDTTRVVVVPSSVPRAGKSPFSGVDVVAFVVQVIRILSDAIPVEGADSVPTVFGSNALALVAPATPAQPSNALVLAAAPAAAAPPVAASSVSGGGGVGGGVPAEHFSMVQKSAAQISTVTTSTRDLHDKIIAFAEDWKQSVNRPKPSTLTNAALEQSVKQLIMENERVKDEIIRRDELIRSLDDRNRDLQKRVDTAAMVAQQLMDEKNSTVVSASDMKLEKDRIVMKLQEQITHASNERDDVHRHLQTVKKLLDVSDSELRDVKGRIDVHNVQAQSLASKLDTSEDALAEERSRRKALEAKVLALQDEIRQGEADLHMKTAAVEELNRKADSERTYYSQIMEDERQRRLFEAQQLRSEIVVELQQREAKFQSDRARVVEDNFKRGHDEGAQIGRNHAKIDVESRMEELMLDSQRAKTELDAYKTELRSATEEAMGENRRLEAIVLQLKKTVDEATRRKAQNEFQAHSLRMKVRNAEDALLVSMTSIAHRLTRPAAPDELIGLLNALKDGENPRLQFQLDAHREERDAQLCEREKWIGDEAFALYEELATDLWAVHLKSTNDLGAQLHSDIGALWRQRDALRITSLIEEESNVRSQISADDSSEFAAIHRWFTEQWDAREGFVVAEAQVREGLEAEAFTSVSDFLGELAAFLDRQRDERGVLEGDEASLRHALSGQLQDELEVAAGDFLAFLEAQRAERSVITSDETECRSQLEMQLHDELDTVAATFMAFVEAQRKERASIVETEENARVPLEDAAYDEFRGIEGLWIAQIEERAQQVEAEEERRNSITAEELAAFDELMRRHEEKVFEKLIAAQRELDEEELTARGELQDSERNEELALVADEAAALSALQAFLALRESIKQALLDCIAAESGNRNAINVEEERIRGSLDSDRADDLLEIQRIVSAASASMNRGSTQLAAGSSNAAQPADGLLLGQGVVIEERKQKSAFAADSSGSDRESSPPPKRAAPQPAPKKTAASASPVNKVAPAALFGSDSDESDTPKPKAPPKKAAAKKMMPKKAQLFDSDSD